MRGDVPGAFRLYEERVRTDAAANTTRWVSSWPRPGSGSPRSCWGTPIVRCELCEEAIAESNEHGESWHKAEALADLSTIAVATGRHRPGERAGGRRTSDPARLRQRGRHCAVPRDPGLDRRHRASAPEGGPASGGGGRIWHAIDASLFPYLLGYRDEYREELRRALGARAFEADYRVGLQSRPLQTTSRSRWTSRTEPVPATDGGAVGGLTRREREIADLVADGLSNREIAAKLVISRRTAEGHVEHILGKLGFTSRVQIAAWVAEHRDPTATERSEPLVDRGVRGAPRLRTSSAGRSGRRCAGGGAPVSSPDVRRRRRADVRARWHRRAG